MAWLIGDHSQLWMTAAKAALMYATALVGLRLAERRTLAEWTIIDFATAVAMGAILGRTAVARDQSYATGAIALATLIGVHRVASIVRFHPVFGKLFDHRIRVLVADGQLRRHELRRCGLTENDVYTQLRQRGVFSLADVRYVLYETKGSITVVPASAVSAASAASAVRGCEDDILQAGLESSVGFP